MRRSAGVALAGLLLLAGCSSSPSAPNREVAPPPVSATASPLAPGPSPSPPLSPSPVPSAPGEVYVAVGASDSVGVGTSDPATGAWPVLFDHSALPPGTQFFDVADSGSTLAQALLNQLPTALDHNPTIVTVWLNVNDIIAGVTPAAYESGLTKLVTGLRRGGQAKVLVANTPPLDNLPAYRGCLLGAGGPVAAFCPNPVPQPVQLDAVVDAYNAATARVTRATGAVLVDLHAAGLAARTQGIEASLVSGDGFHPNDAGYALVARTFAAALKGS